MEQQTKALVPQDPFQMMERLDEDQVLDEIKGRAIDALVYEIRQGSETVTGLSLSGVREVARQMNRSGNARIGITDREPTITETEEYFEVKVFAQDPQNGGGYWGIKRQPKKYPKGGLNQFALEQALAKAQRNAMRGLIPEYFAKEMIDVFRKQKHVKTIEHPREPEPERKVTPEPTPSTSTNGDIPTGPQQLLAAVNKDLEARGYYDKADDPTSTLFHLRGGIAKYLGNPKWAWPNSRDAEGWKEALTAAVQYAKEQRAMAELEAEKAK